MSHSHFINNQWIAGSGESFVSINPSTGKPVWEKNSATAQEVDSAVLAARAAWEAWQVQSLEQRIAFLKAFQEQLTSHQEELANCISEELGKPQWEAATEVKAMIGKVDISIKAYHQRTGVAEQEMTGFSAATRHKSHGVVAVFGPYNFPGHLPNGHIVPALLAGNTVIFKPSEQTPWVAEKTMELWQAAGLPEGVVNMVQGELATGKALASHDEIDGLFFTGSATTGHILHRQFAGQPHKMLALEMGGNNPLIVHDVADVTAAAFHTTQSAFISAGQRCTCARRLILPMGQAGDDFLEVLLEQTQKIKVGDPFADPQPFMGPVVSAPIASKLLEAQAGLQKLGGKSLLEMKALQPDSAFLSPGIMDVTDIANRPDEEVFGPFLQVIRVDSFEEAIKEANNTSFGLSAGLLSDSRELYETFYRKIRAGIVNWNRPLTGASSSAPFGGCGASGNHRPSAYYAADYCAFPVASLEANQLVLPAQLPHGIEL